MEQFITSKNGYIMLNPKNNVWRQINNSIFYVYKKNTWKNIEDLWNILIEELLKYCNKNDIDLKTATQEDAYRINHHFLFYYNNNLNQKKIDLYVNGKRTTFYIHSKNNKIEGIDYSFFENENEYFKDFSLNYIKSKLTKKQNIFLDFYLKNGRNETMNEFGRELFYYYRNSIFRTYNNVKQIYTIRYREMLQEKQIIEKALINATKEEKEELKDLNYFSNFLLENKYRNLDEYMYKYLNYVNKYPYKFKEKKEVVVEKSLNERIKEIYIKDKHINFIVNTDNTIIKSF